MSSSVNPALQPVPVKCHTLPGTGVGRRRIMLRRRWVRVMTCILRVTQIQGEIRCNAALASHPSPRRRFWVLRITANCPHMASLGL
ncbi:hypothetical protein GCM10010840_16560 [Deinococcus aerolatus]|uniref:Uncharacterized protein n=1 Tax=Deinococcus aerolatus TaxID=522487 RepID=A0ABQ2G8N3_9DEIO|nr:hypothetical protein GCM10010840_16560 [Deinococcus aerolatus]